MRLVPETARIPDRKCLAIERLSSSQMKRFLYFTMIGAIATVSCFAGPAKARAQNATTGQGKASSRLEQTAADVIAATQNYRASLERVLAIYERELARRNELAELRQDLYERGVLSKREFEEGSKAQADARRNVDDTRRAIADTDRMLTEAHVTRALARLMPLPRGSYEETPGLVRFNGLGSWSVVRDTPVLQQFFTTRFGRALPISAYGQTALHDRMGLDHRGALDVAVHPDSPEGRVFMDYLRTAGIPFIAAWGAIPGSASGAHIHVGQPSPRITVSR
jgi:hypothetical protein